MCVSVSDVYDRSFDTSIKRYSCICFRNNICRSHVVICIGRNLSNGY